MRFQRQTMAASSRPSRSRQSMSPLRMPSMCLTHSGLTLAPLLATMVTQALLNTMMRQVAKFNVKVSQLKLLIFFSQSKMASLSTVQPSTHLQWVLLSQFISFSTFVIIFDVSASDHWDPFPRQCRKWPQRSCPQGNVSSFRLFPKTSLIWMSYLLSGWCPSWGRCPTKATPEAGEEPYQKCPLDQRSTLFFILFLLFQIRQLLKKPSPALLTEDSLPYGTRLRVSRDPVLWCAFSSVKSQVDISVRHLGCF